MGRIKSVLQNCKFLNDTYTKWKWREHRVSYGQEYPDQTFYVIRRARCKIGLFSHVMTNAGLIEYAVNHGWIPVVDMQNTGNTYLADDQIGRVNAWELFYDQPAGYTLDDIAHARNVILSSGLITAQSEYPGSEVAYDAEALRRWRKVFHQYIQVNKDLLPLYEADRQRLFGTRRVLGVLARGTDYTHQRPSRHPVQPTTEQLIVKITQVMQEQNCEQIYLATEDAEIYQDLKQTFGHQLVALDTERYTIQDGENINDQHQNRENDAYLKGREYLETIWLLSQCQCLVAGCVGGTYGALLMSEGYDYQYVFDLGVYP